MSSGVGKLRRVYKTVGVCRTWSLVLSNPNPPDGFFDAILFINPGDRPLLGDPSPFRMKAPVERGDDFRLRVTSDGGIS